MENITYSLSYIGNYVTELIGLSPKTIAITDDKDEGMKDIVSQTDLAIKYKESIIKSINNDESYEKRVAVPVIIENLSIKINGNKKVKDKIIVHPFNACCRGAEMFAILGGSGSGKSTLLNVIAGRIDKNMVIDGKIHFNGIRNTDCKVGYVQQNDFLLPFLTVRETLNFVAKLKISKDQSLKIDELITDLGLKEIADSLIGDNEWKRGISGGERRRMSIAIQIMSNPAVLCLDEVTSGLDSFTAQTVTESLMKLSKGNRQTTVICSVHQPRADVFYCFDSVLLLSGGKAIYCGSTLNMIKYFSSIGYPCRSDSNPADFFVDLASIDVRDMKNAKIDKIRVEQLVNETMKEENFSLNHVHGPLQVQPVYVQILDETVLINQPSWLSQVLVLTTRFYINNWRDSSNILGGFIQAFVLGLMIMGIFWNLADDNLSAIRSRYGLSYIIISAEPYILMIILVQKYCTDLKIFDREIQDNLYKPSAYLSAHLLSSFPQLFIQPFLYGLPIYYGCGMRAGYNHLLIFLALNILISFVINGIAWMSVSIQRSFAVASLIANMNFTFIGLTSGFLVNFKQLPIYVKWVKYISYHSYSYRILMSNEFSNRMFGGCSSNSNQDCILFDGNFILSQNNVKINDFRETWVVLFAMIIIYHLLALFLLTYIPHPPSGSVGLAADDVEGDNETDFENSNLHDINLKYRQINEIQDENNLFLNSNENVHGVEITLNNIQLSVSLPDLNPRSLNQFVEKKLLEIPNVTLFPGRISGLMGGSGSGKTTLMNLISGRLQVKSKPASFKNFVNNDVIYTGSGSILFNGSAANGEQLRQMIGYVQQNDFHIPSLTVTETLTFHANLRLPTNLSIDKKMKKVNEVIDILGLRLCSSTYVGSDDVKGISGGEKRRLSLGVCLLSDPKVCLIDEVTSGLDTFTARHIVETLHDLARTGRTIVLSIHQPRYDVFALLDDVILLSRGMLVFSGSVENMIRHFSKLSYICPTLTNPADFILDLSSIDFRSETSEQESRERLTILVKAFALTIEQTNEAGIKNIENNDANALAIAAVKDHSIFYTLPLLLSRSVLNQVRQPSLGITRIQQGLSFALILSCFYAPVQYDQNSVQNRIGNLYMMTSLCFIGMLNCIAVFPLERNVFYREYIDGGYSSLGFFLVYLIICIPFLIISAVILSVMMTFAIGLKATLKAFLLFTFVIFSFMYVGEMIGVVYLCLFYHVGFSINIMSVVISFFCMMAGFISIKMALVLERINYISPLKYGAYILTKTIFEDVTFKCDDNEKTSEGKCAIENGEDVLKLYDMYDNTDGDLLTHIWLLAVLCCIYTITAFAILRYRAFKISH